MLPLYWDNKGKYQRLYELLRNLIPDQGTCSVDRPALEKLRKAGNCYYDLYNNGLCNHASEFRVVFGFSGRPIVAKNFNHHAMQTAVEKMIDGFIMAAAKEILTNMNITEDLSTIDTNPDAFEMLNLAVDAYVKRFLD